MAKKAVKKAVKKTVKKATKTILKKKSKVVKKSKSVKKSSKKVAKKTIKIAHFINGEYIGSTDHNLADVTVEVLPEAEDLPQGQIGDYDDSDVDDIDYLETF